ncbi:MAG TPA: GH3 auxin-responsive promoter family protein [Flammeovirgaceae bacterium]|nr:GH3 auxin-responsive promoter family protein [Flammeovirgaceae bacterium]
MEILNSFLTWVMKKRIHQIELFIKYPLEVQQEVFLNLIDKAKDTQFGREHDFANIRNYEHFRQKVPVRNYEELYPYIERMMRGKQNVLWPTTIKWFAKSSGTTNARSKFIPVSPEALEDCHMKGGKDLLSIYINNRPDSRMFVGKSLSIGGSHQINPLDPSGKSYYGDVSAVIMKNLPLWAKYVRTPSEEVALLENWEEKVERMAREVAEENVASMAGVPTWTLLVLQRVLQLTGKDDISEVWPDLEVFFHGAVAFGPYRELFKSIISSPRMQYMETYNASEGFFGIQDTSNLDEMLLMLDYGIFYEFIPFDEIDREDPTVLELGEVETGRNYAMLISTNGGLWRYKIGDTVRFTSTHPYRIKISGRTRHFINAFGEEVIVENAEEAITYACEQTGAIVENFTAGPVYLQQGKQGGHEWLVEFARPPADLGEFTRLLDSRLRQVNSDYDAKRQGDLALVMPKVQQVPRGTFYNWMKKRGKLGGQNKVPRLSNNREYLDDILAMLATQG